ncbi:MAG: LysM peptidoglycan-binding domain-containing protein [Deltaproteobacteria bacterium]|nr:LysM peptidoglycan-binding domain-containing protein [Deltaproteobacteria bacterium]
MNRNSATESGQISLELTEDMLKVSESDEGSESRRGRNGSRSLHLPTIFASAGVFILAVILIVAWVNSDKKSTNVELNTLKLKINMLEGRLSHLEKEIPELQASVTKGQEPQDFLTQRLNALSVQVSQLENQVSSAAGGVGVRNTVQPSSVTQDKGRYHEVRPGETLYRIAKIYGFSVDELCRLNDISPDDVGDIQPGRRLLVSLKDEM